MAKPKYYNSKKIRQLNATYNLIIGERSNGKTYDALLHGLEEYVKTGKTFAYIRRWEEDFKRARGQQLFAGHVANGVISKLTRGIWDGVTYKSHQWYLSHYDEESDSTSIAPQPFCYGFSLATYEHDKSTSYPDIGTIIFDEFLTRGSYMVDEFVIFMNVVSTIVRQRKDVKIFMLANTVNRSSPYFTEMGLKNVRNQKQGTIDLYRYGSSDMTVAVEYCETNEKSKESDTYFAFDNPALAMITGGAWEMALYPHLPYKYLPKEIVFTYFIVWEEDIYQCEIIQHEADTFTYIHRKSTELKKPDTDLIYSMEYSPSPNWNRKITHPRNLTEDRVYWYFKVDKVFYQNNEVGEAIRNYLNACRQ